MHVLSQALIIPTQLACVWVFLLALGQTRMIWEHVACK